VSDITEKISGLTIPRMFLLGLVASFALFLFLLMNALWESSRTDKSFQPVFLAGALVFTVIAASKILGKWK
jgi:hypothetical protein